MMPRMRVLTWNMGYWGHSKRHEEAWRWLLDELRPDVALLQECVPPGWVGRDHGLLFHRASETSRQPWGTAIVASGMELRPVEVPELAAWVAQLGPDAPRRCSATNLPGRCPSAELHVPGIGPLLVVSVHNPHFPIDPVLLDGIDVSAMKLQLAKGVWLLDALFHFLGRHLGRPLLLGGDFNYSRLLDHPKPKGNVEFFDRVAAEGFVSLHRKFHDQDERTYFSKGKGPHQLDYLYADASVAARTTSCSAVAYERVAGLSDHAPLVAELELS